MHEVAVDGTPMRPSAAASECDMHGAVHPTCMCACIHAGEVAGASIHRHKCGCFACSLNVNGCCADTAPHLMVTSNTDLR